MAFDKTIRQVGIGFGVIMFLYFIVSILAKKEVRIDQVKYVEGKIESIEKFKLKNKWSVSYDIKLLKNPAAYKILPDYFYCFDFNQFRKDVKIGQSVKLGIDLDRPFILTSNQSTVFLEVNKQQYIDLQCINQVIYRYKKFVLIFVLGLIVLVPLAYFGLKYYYQG